MNCISAPSFGLRAESFPKVKVPMQMHSARDYALYDEMTCNIEFRTLNSISVPNLVSIAQNFLEPEDPVKYIFPLLARTTCIGQDR